MSCSIEIEGLTKRYGRTDRAPAVNGVTLKIAGGELFFLLGPSGSGKTTFLRMIAGLLAPDAGRILFDGLDVTGAQPHKRGVAMVFQSYALWPHMTVLQNVAYGLRVRRVPKAERMGRAHAALQSVRMEGLPGRRPGELSGGQQQRVALARALVVEPRVLLLDEPLSNLDASLRREMRLEIRGIIDRAGITTLYVTHDQREALSMADRVAVIRDGQILQVDAPRDLYERPRCRFVAGFVGDANFVTATVAEARDGMATLDSTLGRLACRGPAPAPPGQAVTCSIRPEAIRVVDDDANVQNTFSGRVRQTLFFGELTHDIVELADGTAIRIPGTGRQIGDQVRLSIAADKIAIVRE